MEWRSADSGMIRSMIAISLVPGMLVTTTLAVEGELTAEAPAAAWSVSVKQGERLQVTLASDAFDALLLAQQGDGFNQLNDDAGGGTNSALTFVAPADGELTLVASSLDRTGTGAYTLQVNRLVSGKEVTLVPAKVTDSDPDRMELATLAVPGGLTAETGLLVALSVPERDAFLRADLASGESVSADDGWDSLDAELILAPAQVAGAVIHAQVYNDGEEGGDFTIRAEEVTPEPVEPTVSEADAVALLDAQLHGDFHPPLALATYRVAVPAGGTLALTLAGAEIDPLLLVRLPDGRLLSNDDAQPGAGFDSALELTLEEAGEVVVAACNLQGAEGEFQLTATLDGKVLQPAASPDDGASLVEEYLATLGQGEAPAVLAAHSLALVAGQPVTLTAVGGEDSVDPVLLVRMPDGTLQHNDDDGESLNSRLVLESAEDAVVQLAVLNLRGVEGAVELKATAADGTELEFDEAQGDPAELVELWMNPPVPEREFPSDWFFGQTQNFADLEGKALPALPLADLQWRGDALEARDLEGKVVVLDLWTTWCGPCVAAIPHNQELAVAHPDDLVILGLCLENSAEEMDSILADAGASYPAAYLDAGARTFFEENLVIEFFPTYVVIDRNGIVRAAGLSPQHLGEVVEQLMAEEPSAAAPAEG